MTHYDLALIALTDAAQLPANERANLKAAAAFEAYEALQAGEIDSDTYHELVEGASSL